MRGRGNIRALRDGGVILLYRTFGMVLRAHSELRLLESRWNIIAPSLPHSKPRD